MPVPAPTLAPSLRSQPLTVALIGNPNTGKSTLFNALSGSRTLTGNYPGVTVEKTVGQMQCGDRAVNLVDLPGTYSLAPRSLDEMVAVNVLLGRMADIGTPDVVVCIVDASNIERNLYLVSQVLDLGLPTVLVLNMADVAATRGVAIDAKKLSERLSLPVVVTEAHRHQGIEAVREAILEATARGPLVRPKLFPPAFMTECDTLVEKLAEWGQPQVPYYLRERLLLDVGGYVEGHFLADKSHLLKAWLTDARARLSAAGCKVPAVEARVRYAWVREILDGAVVRPATRPVTASDKIDRVLTHRVAGLVIFALVMLLIFAAISWFAQLFMDAFESGQGWVAGLVGLVLAPGPLRSLVVDGVIAGVGGVLIFLPQILILFFFIALLEDCGYMARAAFLMDRLMTKVGLSGKSFVPMMSSFACAIPGVMAARVIENRRDRLTTILVAPLMSCSARQPVYVLMIGAFIPAMYLGGWLQPLVLFAMTFYGAVVAIPVAWILKKTLLRGETPPFVMELPSYKWPSWRLVFNRVYAQGKEFVQRAGTLIFATSMLIWAAGYFPGDHTQADKLQAKIEKYEADLSEEQKQAVGKTHAILGEFRTETQDLKKERPTADAQRAKAIDARLKKIAAETKSYLETLNAEQRDYLADSSAKRALDTKLLESSLLGQFGHAIEPAVKPLGWDWRIGVGVIASFPAREVIVSTLGTIYSLGGEVEADDQGLRSAIRHAEWPDGRKVYNIPVALSVMVFFALCAQCASTLMVIHRETGHWGWPVFTFTYMTFLAYAAAFVTYRLGMLLGM